MKSDVQGSVERMMPGSASSSRSNTPTIPLDAVDGEFVANHASHPGCPNSLDCLPDTNDRPQHTFSTIVRSAILGSAKQRLTIREIYLAMENKFPYFKTAAPAWKQSVRHHLSLNRLFERQSRPPSDPGTGDYWTVNLEAPPGTKRPRKRGPPADPDAKARIRRRLEKGKSKEAASFDDDEAREDKMSIVSETEGTLEVPQKRHKEESEPPDSAMSDSRSSWTPRPTFVDTQEQATAQAELFKLLERYQQEIIRLRQELSAEKNKRWRVSDQLHNEQARNGKLQREYEVLKKNFELEQKERVALEAAWAERTFLSYDPDKLEEDG